MSVTRIRTLKHALSDLQLTWAGVKGGIVSLRKVFDLYVGYLDACVNKRSMRSVVKN